MASVGFTIGANEDYTCNQGDLNEFVLRIIHQNSRDPAQPKDQIPAEVKNWKDTYNVVADATATRDALVAAREAKKNLFLDIRKSVAQPLVNYHEWHHLPRVDSTDARVQTLAKRIWESSTEHNPRQKLCEMLYTCIIILHHFKTIIDEWADIPYNDFLTKKTNRQQTFNNLIDNIVVYIPLMVAVGGKPLTYPHLRIYDLDKNGSVYYHFVIQTVQEHAVRLFPKHQFNWKRLEHKKLKAIFNTYKTKVEENGIFHFQNLRLLNSATPPALPPWISGLPHQIWNIFTVLNHDAREVYVAKAGLSGLRNYVDVQENLLAGNNIQHVFPGHPMGRMFTLKGECLYEETMNESMEEDADNVMLM